MKPPSNFTLFQSLTFAILICAIPSCLIFSPERPWASTAVFFFVAQFHALLLGVPAIRFLLQRDALSGLSSTLTGMLLGALPTAHILVDGFTGPGYVQSFLRCTAGGAAIGFAFWLSLRLIGEPLEAFLSDKLCRASSRDESARPTGARTAHQDRGLTSAASEASHARPMQSDGTRGPAGETPDSEDVWGADASEREREYQIFRQVIASRRKSDPLIGAKIGGKEVFDRLTTAMVDGSGVRAETLLCTLGALAGYACQARVRAQARAMGAAETSGLVTLTDGQGRNYFIGDKLNQALFESRYSVWSLTAASALHHGCARLPDIEELANHVAATLGTEAFGVPRLPEGHAAGHAPVFYVKSLWPVLLPVVKWYCEDPHEWPMLFAFAVQAAMDSSALVLPPEVAMTIVWESALPMSRIDLEVILAEANHTAPAPPGSASEPEGRATRQ